MSRLTRSGIGITATLLAVLLAYPLRPACWWWDLRHVSLWGSRQINRR